MSAPRDSEQLFPRPLSQAAISRQPSALIPARSPRYARLEPQDAGKHAAPLYEAGHESEAALRIWDYLTYGPWPSVEAYAATLRQQSASFDPIFYAVRPLDAGAV